MPAPKIRRGNDDRSLRQFCLDFCCGVTCDERRLVYFVVNYGSSILYRYEFRGKHIKPVVNGAEIFPFGHFGRLGTGMNGIIEFLKKLTRKRIPVAEKPGVSYILRKIFKTADIIRIAFQQCVVVINRRENKFIIIGIFTRFVFATDKKPLDPTVSYPAGVAGEVHSLGKIVYAPDRCREHFEHLFGNLRSFVYGNNIVLLPLILPDIVLAAKISELD